MTVEPILYDVKMYKNADFCLSFYLKDEDGNTMDFTGGDIVFEAAPGAGQASTLSYSYTANPAIITIDTDNKININIVAATTAAVTQGSLYFHVDSIDTVGARDRRWIGTIEVIEGVA